MKIAIISKYGSVPGSGTLTRLFYISKYLSKAGHSVHYYISDSNHLGKELNSNYLQDASQKSGVTIKSLSLIKYDNQKSVKRLLSWVQFELKLFFSLLFRKQDLLIVSSPSIFTIFTGVLLKFFHGSKLIVDIRDIWPMTLIEEGGISERHPLMRVMHWLQNLGYRKADLVLSSIPNLKKHIQEQINEDRKFHCLPMGYDAGDDLPQFEAPQKALDVDLPKDKLVVGYVGSIGPTNNLDTFIDYIYREDSGKFHFLIVGDGSCFEDYKSKLGGLGHVTFTGRVSKAIARSYIQHCDVMYFATHESSIWKYGQSLNKLLDYMLMGKSVVAAYPEFGFKSMINEAECGYFIKSNCLSDHKRIFEELSSMDKNSLEKVGGAGKDWILEKRDYNKLVNEFDKVIKDV